MVGERRWRTARTLVVAGIMANVIGHSIVISLEANVPLSGIIATIVPFLLGMAVLVGPRWLLTLSAILAALATFAAFQAPVSMARLIGGDDPVALVVVGAEVAGLLVATVAGALGTYQAYRPRRALPIKGAA